MIAMWGSTHGGTIIVKNGAFKTAIAQKSIVVTRFKATPATATKAGNSISESWHQKQHEQFKSICNQTMAFFAETGQELHALPWPSWKPSGRWFLEGPGGGAGEWRGLVEGVSGKAAVGPARGGLLAVMFFGIASWWRGKVGVGGGVPPPPRSHYMGTPWN